MSARTVRLKLPLRGIHIGPRCIDGSEFGTQGGDPIVAHAHPRGCPPVGFICARTLTDFSEQITHELAHLATARGHDERWRAALRKLGGRVPAAYRPRRTGGR